MCVRRWVRHVPSQFEAVATEACLALVRSGKVSPITAQANGPQVIAKEAMNMQAATIMTMPELSYSIGGRAVATLAKISSQVACQIAPTIKGIRRPNFSIM